MRQRPATCGARRHWIPDRRLKKRRNGTVRHPRPQIVPSPPVVILGPQVVILGPQVVILGPQVVILGPQVVILGLDPRITISAFGRRVVPGSSPGMTRGGRG